MVQLDFVTDPIQEALLMDVLVLVEAVAWTNQLLDTITLVLAYSAHRHIFLIPDIDVEVNTTEVCCTPIANQLSRSST